MIDVEDREHAVRIAAAVGRLNEVMQQAADGGLRLELEPEFASEYRAPRVAVRLWRPVTP